MSMSPLSPSSSETFFSWANNTVAASSPSTEPDRRPARRPGLPSPDVVSVIGISMTSHSGIYVFSADSPDSPYMNLLYSAVQRQGRTGSVEMAMSPYLAMTGNGNVRNMRNASVDSVSAIYAQIVSDGETSSGNGGGGSGKSKALAEFRELMVEV